MAYKKKFIKMTKPALSAMLIASMLMTTGCGNNSTKSVAVPTQTKTSAEFVTPVSVTNDDRVAEMSEEDRTTLEGYELVAENDDYELYLLESTLAIIMRNKHTGALMTSTLSEADDDGTNNKTWLGYMKSGIVLSAIKGTTDTYQVDLLTCENTIDITKTDNGFSANIYFTEYGFGMTLNVSLEENSIVVSIPDESIVEDMEDIYIGTISIYPFMGYTYLDSQNGYMFVPDGNGALIYLDDKDKQFSSGFSQMIYGIDLGVSDAAGVSLYDDDTNTINEAEQVLAPIFGMVHSDDQIGYLAIVESGEKRASIESQPNGVMVAYNRCFAKFIERQVYVQPLNNSNTGSVQKVEEDRTHDDLQVRYLFVTEEDANYSGMAVQYRNYLLENELVEVQDTTYKTRVDFLGTDREEWMVGTKAITMTTVDNITSAYNELQEEGVENLLTIYKGWQDGGLYNVPITSYKADSHIGGTSDLTDLILDSKEEGYDIYLYNDALRINVDENTFTYNAVKRINKRTLEEELYARVYDMFYFLNPSKTISNLKSLVKSYEKEDITNIAISGISNELYSYYYKNNYYSRIDCANNYQSILETVDESMNLILEQPFAYLWNNTEAFLDMPTESSQYMYLDEEVPFLSIALKGIIPMYSEYVNFEANKEEFMLKMLEAGVYPSFYMTYEDSSELINTNSAGLYSTKFSSYKDTIVEYNQIFSEVASLTEDSYIISHEKPATNVVKVTYDNGVILYLNYNKTEVTIDGLTLDAMSYKVGEANE